MASTNDSKAVLVVFAEVGDHVSESKFHVLVRRTIYSAYLLVKLSRRTHLVQEDNQRPTWGTIYDLKFVNHLQDEAYTNLA